MFGLYHTAEQDKQYGFFWGFVIFPLRGLINPAMALSNVDFPAPLSPVIAIKEPALNFAEKPLIVILFP